MKNLKRVLALVIALVFVMGTVAFADTTDTTTEPAAYAKAQDLLGQLNIMVGDENGNFNADKTITKGEAARIIYSLLVEMGGTLPGVDTVFSDVTSLYWGSGYINALNGASINGANVINGTGDGTFAPTKLLSYDEINTMLTIALGYQPYAKRNGGFPYGYRTAASKAKLYDNTFGTVTYGGSKGITRGEVAILVANALIANPMVPTGYSDDGTSYDFDDKTIFATSNCGLTMASGVARTAGSNFTIMTPATDDVDPTGLKAGDSKIKEAIGLNVIVFYNSGKTIEGMVVTGERASLASGTKFWFDGSKVSVDGEKTKYTVAKGAKLTINGTEVSAENLNTATDGTTLVESLIAANSTLKVTLYGSDTTANEVAVEIYNAGKVDTIYKSTNNVRIKMDGKDASKLFTVKKGNDTFTKADGEAGTVADMTAGSFVKVTPIVKDASDKIDEAVAAFKHNIVVAETKLEDVYASRKTSDDKFTIDGTVYTSNTKLGFDPDSVTTGTTGTFTLDVNNKIVAFAASEEATNEYIGYITFAQVYNSGRNSGKATFDIVIDGKKLSYTTTDVVGDGKVADAIKTLGDVNKKDGDAIEEKLIASIKLDKNDNVTAIKFVAKGTPADLKYNKALNKLSATDKTPIYLSSSSKVYTIDTKGKIVEKELSYLTNGTTYSGVVEIKNFKNKVVGIMITGDAAVDTANTAMVTRDATTDYIDGQNYTTVEILVHGEEDPVLLMTTKNVLDGMKKGYYISYKVDGDGLVTAASCLAKYDPSAIKYNASEASLEIKGTAYSGTNADGYATIIKKDVVTVTYSADKFDKTTTKATIDAIDTTFDVSDNLKVYVYNVTDGTILSSTVGSDLFASEFVYNGTTDTDTVKEAYYNAMFVNVVGGDGADKNDITEIVIYTNLKTN